MNPLSNALFSVICAVCLGSHLVAQQPQQQPAQPPPPNQVALTEAREHAKAGRTAEALAALERVTPPAPAVVNQLRTSDDFKLLRDDERFKAIVTKLTPCFGYVLGRRGATAQ